MVDTGFALLDIGQPMLLKQKRKQELNLFWQLFALSRGFLSAFGGKLARLRDILGLHI